MKTLLTVFFLHLPVLIFANKQGKELVDSLLKELPRHDEDTNKVKMLNELSFYMSDYDPKEGLKYGLQAIELSKKLEYDAGEASGYSSLSVNYMELADYDKSIDFSQKSLKIYEALGNKQFIAGNYGNIASCYQAEGNFAKAMEYQLKDLKIAEEIGNKKIIASSELNIANIYSSISDYAKAKEYLFRALSKDKDLGNKTGIANCLINIGSIFYQEGNFDSAFKYYNEALPITEALGNKASMETIYINFCSIYRQRGKFHDALAAANKAIELSREMNDNESIGGGYNELGEIYLSMAKDKTLSDKAGNSRQAISYFEQSLGYAKDYNNPQLLAEIYSNLSTAYESVGNDHAALLAHQSFKAITDSILSTDSKLKIAQLGTQRETDLKEEQIRINKIQQAKERNERIFFIIGLGLLSALVIVVLRSYSKEKRIIVQLKSFNKQLGEEKEKTDKLAWNLQKSVLEKEAVAGKLAALMDMKSRFFGNISHELRTPVTLLTGMLELMKDKSLGQKEKEQLDIAYNNSRRLQRMIEEMLDLSRVESKLAKVNSEPRQAAPLLKRIISSFDAIAQKEELRLIYEDTAGKNAYINVDEDKFEKIINNLIFNAIKFNKRGGAISVRSHMAREGSVLAIEVRDTGKGINVEDLPYIFDRFYQGATRNKTKAEGVGIGLSLVKEFTLLLGGTIDVSSIADTGTIFTLQFPVTEHYVEEKHEDITLPVQDWENGDTKSAILIIEDNADMRYYLREVLGNKVNIAEAPNGVDALARMEQNIPDLIICDMMMPEMDGREFVTRIKQDSRFNRIPVVTLTALADMENHLSMLRLGVDDYMVKPFNADELRIRVHNLLQNLSARKKYIEEEVAEPGDVPINDSEANEFRDKLTACVLGKIGNFHISVNDIAAELGYSERQLYRFAKSVTGCTPAHLIKEIRLLKAYELLGTGKVYKIDDLAKRVGYEHISYFSKQFYERFGKRPTEYLS